MCMALIQNGICIWLNTNYCLCLCFLLPQCTYSLLQCILYRPWYIASATPKPKDVVLVIKNNIFAGDDVRDKSFEAANIILRTLNPKDRVSVKYWLLKGLECKLLYYSFSKISCSRSICEQATVLTDSADVYSITRSKYFC